MASTNAVNVYCPIPFSINMTIFDNGTGYYTVGYVQVQVEDASNNIFNIDYQNDNGTHSFTTANDSNTLLVFITNTDPSVIDLSVTVGGYGYPGETKIAYSNGSPVSFGPITKAEGGEIGVTISPALY